MDNSCITSPTHDGMGQLTTFYSWQSGPARSLALANTAWLLAGRQHASKPVLMIDWDLESPNLHYLFGANGHLDGLVELLEACRDRYTALMKATDAGSAADPDDVAGRVLAAIDWQRYVERVDAGRPLYMLRAGRFDDTYGERAAQLDWRALYDACPALLRQLRIALAQTFSHVFIDARGGRSAAVSVCTALLPDKIVGLFTPHPASLDGLCGAMERAIAFRCSHEDEQRPLLLYPLACVPAGASRAQCMAWRRGPAGYQERLEALMRASYGRKQVSLEHYLDDMVLYPDTVFAGAVSARDLAEAPSARTLAALLDWHAGFPWQSRHGAPGLRTVGSGHGASAPDTHVGAPGARTGQAQFPALRHLDAWLGGVFGTATHAGARAMTMTHIHQVADALEAQLDQLQHLVDRQALGEARPLADALRHTVLRPAVAFALRRRGAALIKLVYRHDNDTDALLAFTQDELASLERVLNDAAAGRPLAYS